jgi:hypothetical protein
MKSLRQLVNEGEENYQVLISQIAETDSMWRDSVKRKFYADFLEAYQKQGKDFFIGLDQLDRSIESAERQLENIT